MSDMLESAGADAAGGLPETTPEAWGAVVFSFESRVADIMQAVTVVDRKNRMESRRNLEGLALVIVLWMFVPSVMENPADLMSWIMIALSLAIMGMLWKYPDYSNRKFAARKVAQSPLLALSITRDGIEVTDGDAHHTISFAEKMNIYEYQEVFAVSYSRNHLLTIPKGQLDGETIGRTRALFRQGLGDRFEDVGQPAAPRGFFNKRK